MWKQSLYILNIEQVLGAVVHAKAVARVQIPRGSVVGEDRVRPVQVWRGHELQRVATSQVDALAVLHDLRLKVLAGDECLEELDANLGAQDREVIVPCKRCQLQHVCHQARVVWLRVRHHQVFQGPEVHHGLQLCEVQVSELCVGGVDEAGHDAWALDQEGVVGGAPLQCKLNVEAVALPVQGSEGGGVGGQLLLRLDLQFVLLPGRQATPRLHLPEGRPSLRPRRRRPASPWRAQAASYGGAPTEAPTSWTSPRTIAARQRWRRCSCGPSRQTSTGAGRQHGSLLARVQ
mmetsp:Transcript_87941/g.226722  ORF Transcript_87941/g.226722 Transcript_87941/m.226722 type:complete len:290 (-) Transcript_87941:1656-2525(-)